MNTRFFKNTLLTLATCAAFASSAFGAAALQRTQSGGKLDILFVVDNSGSMNRSIEGFVASMPVLLEKLQSSGVDYRIGVTTTDSYLYQYGPAYSGYARLKDGVANTHSGVFVITPQTPDLANVLATNLRQGTNGAGDERAFSSFREVLQFTGNADFRRPEAALSVVLLSDEDDFSHNDVSDDKNQPMKNYYFTEDYNDPKMYPVQEFNLFLKSLVAKPEISATFSTISVLDAECLQYLGVGKLARRTVELSQLSNGIAESICDIPKAVENYANFALSKAAPPSPAEDYLIKLDHTPIVDTIVVKVNGRWIAKDENNGWSYNSEKVAVVLHGMAIPKKGDVVSVNYDYEE